MGNTTDMDIQIDPISDLHKMLTSRGYELPNVNTFRKDMSDISKRERLHATMQAEGDYLKPLDDFNSRFFGESPVKKKETTPSPTSAAVAEQPTKPSATIQSNTQELNSFVGDNSTGEVVSAFGIKPDESIKEAQAILPQRKKTFIDDIPVPHDAELEAERKAIESDKAKLSMGVGFETGIGNSFDGKKELSAIALREAAYQKKAYNNLAAQNTTKEKYGNGQIKKNENPADWTFIAENFSNMDGKTQTAIAQYLDDMKLENPQRYKETIGRIRIQDSGDGGDSGIIIDPMTGAVVRNSFETTTTDLRFTPKQAVSFAQEAIGKRINEKEKDLSIYASRKQIGKGVVDTEHALSQHEDIDRLKQDFKATVLAEPEEAARQAKAKLEKESYKGGGFWNRSKQTVNGVINVLNEAAVSIINFSNDFRKGEGHEYDALDKVFDQFAEAADMLKGDDASDEKLSGGNVIPKMVKQVANMGLLFAGGELYGGGKVGLTIAGMITQYRQFKDDATQKKGLSDKDGMKYAFAQSFIQGFLENISPNFGSLAQRGARSSMLDLLQSNPLATTKTLVKHGFEQIVKENTQEFMQLFAQKGGNAITNQLIGKDKFDIHITKDEALETFILTTLATGAVTGATSRAHLKNAQQEQFNQLLENPDETKADIDELITEGKLSTEQGAQVKKSIDNAVKAKESPTPSVEKQKVQEVNEEDLTKEQLLNEPNQVTAPVNTNTPTNTEKEYSESTLIKKDGVVQNFAEVVHDFNAESQGKQIEVTLSDGTVHNGTAKNGIIQLDGIAKPVALGDLITGGIAKIKIKQAITKAAGAIKKVKDDDKNKKGGINIEEIKKLPTKEAASWLDDTMDSLNSIDFDNVTEAREKVRELLGIVNNKDVPDDKVEQVLKTKSGLIGSQDYLTRDYIEKYLLLTAKDFTNYNINEANQATPTEAITPKEEAKTEPASTPRVGESKPSGQSEAATDVVQTDNRQQGSGQVESVPAAKSNTISDSSSTITEPKTPITEKQPKKIKINDETGAIVLEGDNGYNVSIVKKSEEGKGVISETQDFATEQEANDFVESKKAQPKIESATKFKVAETDKKFGLTNKDLNIGDATEQSVDGIYSKTTVTNIAPLVIDGFDRDLHIVESELNGKKYYQVYDSSTGLVIGKNAVKGKNAAISIAKQSIERANINGTFDKISKTEENIAYNNQRKAEGIAAQNELKNKKQSQNKEILDTVADGKSTTFKATKNKGEFISKDGHTVTESPRIVDGKKYVTVKTSEGVELNFNRPTSIDQKTALAVVENTLNKNPISNNQDNKDENTKSIKGIVSDLEKAGFTFSKGSLESIVSAENNAESKNKIEDGTNAERITETVKSVRDTQKDESNGSSEKSGGTDEAQSVAEQYGWKAEKTDKGYNLFNRKGVLAATVTQKGNKYTIANSGGEKILSGSGQLGKAVDSVIKQYFYGQKVENKTEVFKPNTPTEINDTNLVDSIDGAEQHIEEVKASLDEEIKKAELELKKAGRETLMNAGLPINPRQIEAATKLAYFKFKKFMYDTGIAPKLQELADAIGVSVSERFKGIYENVKAIWTIENSSGFHESLGYAQQARRLFQDKNIAIKNLFKDLAKVGVPIQDSTNFAEMQELTMSRIADAQRRAADWFRGMKANEQITGIEKSKRESWVGRVIAQVGRYETQRDYMYAKHALDYNARAREIFENRRTEAITPLQEEVDALTDQFLKETDPKKQKKLQEKITKINNEITELQSEAVPDQPSGMTDAEAKVILDEAALDPDKMAKMDALAKEFRDETVIKRIDLLEKSGMINAETAKNMREGKREGYVTEMPNYLPLKVRSENFTEGMRPTTSMGKLGSQIFGIQITDKYGKEQRYDPLQMAMTELQATQSAAINNEALVGLYNAVKQSPFGKNIKIIKSRGTYAANEHGELADTKTEAKVEVRDLLNDHAIPFKVDGKVKYIFFTPIKNEKGQLIQHPIIQALKANPSQTGTFGKALLNGIRTMTNYLRLIRTTYNLGFAADNPFRDLGEALSNISDVSQSEINAINVKLKTETDPNVIKALNEQKQELGLKVEKIRLQIIKNMPTAFGFFFNPSKKRVNLDGTTRNKEFEQYWDEMRENGVMMSWGNYEGIDEKIDDFQKDIERMEQGKFGKTATEQAATTFKILGALSEATENTTRIAVFAGMRQNGYSAQKAAYVAKNITLNFEKGGTATKWTNMLWMFSNAGIQSSARMMKTAKTANFWRFGAAMTAFAFANRALLLGLSDDDDENKWIYNNLENRGRTLIYNPLDPKNPIRLPKPYSAMRLFLNTGEGIADILHGKRVASDVAVDNLVSTMTSTIDPIGGSGNSLTNYTPFEPLRNFVQIQANQNWAGQEIMRGEDKLEDKKILDHLRSNPSTNAIFDKAALGLYNKTGLSIQPTTLEYFWDDYGKNAAKSVTDYAKIGEVIYDKATGKEVKAEEIPALKRFYTNVDDKRGTVLYGVMDLIKDPTQGTKEQVRYIESMLPKLQADKTISQYFIKRIKDGLAEMKDVNIKQNRDKKNTDDFGKNIELKDKKETVKQIKGKQ